ncbi:MAG: hypothetical protein HQ557_06720, partial [Bacteroidetes bacterium]|nr:hypothetical protein [Bacteroidota bacterium]
VLPATVFAGSFLGLKVGAAATLNEEINLNNLEETDLSEIGLDSFSFGADIRFNITIVELSALIQGQFLKGADANMALVPEPLRDIAPGPFTYNEDVVFLYGQVGLGLGIDLLGLVNLGVTVGPELGIYASESVQVPTVNFDDFKKFPLKVRANIGVNLGGISVGGFLIVDPNVTIGEVLDEEFDWQAIATIPATATAGLSVLVSLF